MAQNASSGSKGKKFKGKTMPLDSLLLNEIPHVNWAEAVETENMKAAADNTRIDIVTKTRIVQTRLNLPSAPKAARSVNVNTSQVPTEGPFRAYVGNIPYDSCESDIRVFFEGLKIENIKLIPDKETGQIKGHGYVHFQDRESLIQALEKDQEKIRDREVRVDLSKDTSGDGGSNWRNERQTQPRQENKYQRTTPPPPQQQGAYGPRPQMMGGYRQSSMDQMGYPPRNYDPMPQQHFQPRPPPQMQGGYPRGGGYAPDYGRQRPAYNQYEQHMPRGGYEYHMGGRGYEPPPLSRSESYGTYPRRGAYDNLRGRGGGHDRRDNPVAAHYPDDHYGRYPDPQYGPPPPRSARGDYYNPRHVSRGGEGGRGGIQQGRYTQHDDTRHESRGAPAPKEEPKTRPKLQLQPRTKPRTESECERAEEESSKAAIIFGGAKPVDTTRRESDIEQKIEKEKQMIHQKLEEERGENARPLRVETRRHNDRTYSQSNNASNTHRIPRSPTISHSPNDIKLTPGAGQVRILSRSRPNSESQPEKEGDEVCLDKRKHKSVDVAQAIIEEVETENAQRVNDEKHTNGGDVTKRANRNTRIRTFNRGRPASGSHFDRGAKSGRGVVRGGPRGGNRGGRGGKMRPNNRTTAGASPPTEKILPTFEEPKPPDFKDSNRFNLLGSDDDN